MTLYQSVLAKSDARRITIILEQFGSQAKPWFMCQLRYTLKGVIQRDPLNFFLEQLPEAAEAIEATISLARGLLVRVNEISDLEATWEFAVGFRETLLGIPWPSVLSTCCRLEMDSQ